MFWFQEFLEDVGSPMLLLTSLRTWTDDMWKCWRNGLQEAGNLFPFHCYCRISMSRRVLVELHGQNHMWFRHKMSLLSVDSQFARSFLHLIVLHRSCYTVTFVSYAFVISRSLFVSRYLNLSFPRILFDGLKSTYKLLW